MRYVLQKLNVVKTVERADKRDALLAQGFTDITPPKKATAKNPKQTPKIVTDGEQNE